MNFSFKPEAQALNAAGFKMGQTLENEKDGQQENVNALKKS